MRWAVLAVLVAACGTTHIHTDDPRARIYVDGVLAGTGDADVTRRGKPATTDIVVVAPDGRRAHMAVSRSFTATTLAAGLITYFVGWLAVWELPESIHVPLPAGFGWDDTASPWDVAPSQRN
jgi:hypothetical protein